MGEPNLFRALQTEWDRDAESADGRAALARWATESDVLRDVASPLALVVACQGRRDRHRSAALLGAVLAHARDDAWAARTVLQAVLPGLVRLTHRARPVLAASRDWADPDDVDQHVVALACERIHALGAEAPPWPAQAIIDSTWARLRAFLRSECRHAAHRAELAEGVALASARRRSAGEELAEVLAEAVERRLLEPVDGWVLLACHTRREPFEELAAEVGRNKRWFSRHRARAERLLCHEGARVLAEAAL